jgi:hypothetical protein
VKKEAEVKPEPVDEALLDAELDELLRDKQKRLRTVQWRDSSEFDSITNQVSPHGFSRRPMVS